LGSFRFPCWFGSQCSVPYTTNRVADRVRAAGAKECGLARLRFIATWLVLSFG